MFIYGPSVTENIEMQNNENLEIFFKYYNDSPDKDRQVQKTRGKIERRIKLAKHCKK